MSDIIQSNQVENLIITIRNERVLLDSDVAMLYGVGTKEINQAVKNNPDKFPYGYVLTVDFDELKSLRSKFLTLEKGKGEHTKYPPKAIKTENKGLLFSALGHPISLSKFAKTNSPLGRGIIF